MTRALRLAFILWLQLLFSPLAAERAILYLRLTDSLTMDPGKFEDFYSQEVIFNVFEGLVRLGKDPLSVEPCLAERWLCNDDGKRWIFYLRRGVRFHNGREFNASAVVYSFSKRLEKKQGEYVAFGRFFPYITAVKALDDWTVEIVLSRPYFPFLFSLTDLRSSIVAPGSCDGPEFKPIGTGPFVFAEWVRGKSLLLIRNDRYWQRPAKLEKIIFKSEPNVAIRLSQLKNLSGDINLIRSANEYDELRYKTHIAIVSKPMLITYYLGFNCRRQPFSRLPARKAINHLLKKKVMFKQVFQNFAVPATGFLPPQFSVSGPDLFQDEFNPELARRLLQEMGLAKGFSCSLIYSEGQFGLEEIARTIVANARRINVTIKASRLPFAKLIQAVQNGDPDLFLVGWGFTVDPGMFLNPMFMLDPAGSGKIMSMGPEYSRILAQAAETADKTARWQLYATAEHMLMEELPLIPLFHLNHLMAYNSRLKDLRMNLFGFMIFKDASLSAE